MGVIIKLDLRKVAPQDGSWIEQDQCLFSDGR
jgi:hypothetical protein